MHMYNIRYSSAEQRRRKESHIYNLGADSIVKALEALGFEVSIQGTKHITIRGPRNADERHTFTAQVWVDSEGLKYGYKDGNVSRCQWYRPSVRQTIRRLTGVIPNY